MRRKNLCAPLTAVVLSAGTLAAAGRCQAQMMERWSEPTIYGDVYATGHYRGGPQLGILVSSKPGDNSTSLSLIDATTGSIVWTYAPVWPNYIRTGEPQSHPRFLDGDGDGVDDVYLFTPNALDLTLTMHCFTYEFATQTRDPEPPTGTAPPAPSRLEVGLARPNPASDGVEFAMSVPAPGPVDVTLYDVTGRVVRSIHEAASKAGDLTVRWDGHDCAGRQVAPGSYYYQVKTSAGASTRSLIWIR